MLEWLVGAALADAAADEVTPPLTAGPAWTPERVAWLRAHHLCCRSGLDGEAGEATWAVLLDGEVVGAVRLARVDDGVLETGAWLTRGARGRGVGTAALRLVLEQAAASRATVVRAETTAGNGAALSALRRIGFTCRADAGGAVRARLALGLGPRQVG